jgi:hypothetical protein
MFAQSRPGGVFGKASICLAGVLALAILFHNVFDACAVAFPPCEKCTGKQGLCCTDDDSDCCPGQDCETRYHDLAGDDRDDTCALPPPAAADMYGTEVFPGTTRITPFHSALLLPGFHPLLPLRV